MAPEKVLKIPRTDQDAAFVLVHVATKGSKPLDLKLVGTEGAAPYTCSLKHDRVSSLRVPNSPVSEKEWQNILISVFEQELLSDIQATATVRSESSISLTIRKQVQGITQRLGDISLRYETNETIELFDWCGISADALTQSQQSAAESVSKLSGVQASVEDLKRQLDELIQAKQEDELVLLESLKDLLNEKKVKIRQQQAIIAELSVNGTIQPEEPKPADAQPQAKLLGKRATKRKATAVEAEEPDKDANPTITPEPENSDVDTATEETVSLPTDDERGGDESDDTDGDNDGDKSSPRSKPQGSAEVATKAESSKRPAATPPPPRALPFQRKKPVAAANDTEDTDSGDEL
ncbi:hypothetical protein E4U13_002770 [Claviceps humidiphila]|uniref:Mitotic apparatus protein p62 n=1 Tax=Claviceps humidiphila TaxID=1294629 RepID=A0A9P7TQ99_9HYPO|nr:hypothetical protein E4U13_002770 [Claviceps humidiphila]